LHLPWSNRLKARREFSRRVLFVLFFVGAFLSLAPSGARAQDQAAQQQAATAYAEKYALNFPADITPRATHGVMLSLARAGDRLVAVGERGWIIVSDDNGNTWRQIPTSTSVTLDWMAGPWAAWAWCCTAAMAG
jgi:photosystem II stability/assembly factor-like uncharacterized protein